MSTPPTRLSAPSIRHCDPTSPPADESCTIAGFTHLKSTGSAGSPPQSSPASEGGTPAHDHTMAAAFLSALNPAAACFTFQMFSDGPDKYAEIFHGTLDEVWPHIQALNTVARRVGVFVCINETDLRGRKSENVLRPRALFVDADDEAQITTCTGEVARCGAPPSMIVKSGRGIHLYWLCDDVSRDEFSRLQKKLADRLGTDGAVVDLPRVMRLPGTLHLKDKDYPRLVKLIQNGTPRRWALGELAQKLGLGSAQPTPPDNVVPFPNVARSDPAPFAFDVATISAAIDAIPPEAIASEPDWMRFARALAHTAAMFPELKEPLWEQLERASTRAPGYDKDENRRKFERYVSEAFDQPHPITLATVFRMAEAHGWTRPDDSSGSTGQPQPVRAVPVSSIPAVPAKRQWLHGTDLVRGAITLLVAPGGRAKSTWLIGCALACASGRALLDAHVFGGPLRVLLLSAEDALPELSLRIRAAMNHYGLSNADVPELHLIGAENWGLSLLRGEGNRGVLNRAGWEALHAELDRLRPDVLIIDPLINLMGGVSANDNAAAAVLMQELAGVAAVRRIAIAIAHHAAKNRDPASAESALGAASFINLARVALAIEPLDEKNAGQLGVLAREAKRLFRIVGTKQNLSPPSSDDRWFRLVSVEIRNAEPPVYMNGDAVAVIEPFQPPTVGARFSSDLLRSALNAIDKADPPLSLSKNATQRYAAPVVARAIASHLDGRAVEVDGRAVLDHMLDVGLVRVDDVKLRRAGKGADTRKGLALTQAGQELLAATEPPFGATSPQSPQSPQSPATSSRDCAGGDPCGSPATQGGCGGNAGGPKCTGDVQ